MVSYQAHFEPEGDLIVVTFPDVGHGATTGANETEALEMAEDFLVMVLNDMMEHGKALPIARKHRGPQYRTIRLSALVSAKIELYRIFLASGLTRPELANQLGISPSSVDRLFDLNARTRLDLIDSALKAVGHRLTIDVEAA